MTTIRFGLLAAATLATATAVAGWAARPAAGDPPSPEVARERYNLAPVYLPGHSFRVTTRWKQSTYSGIAQGVVRAIPANQPGDYDGSMEIDSLVRIENVDGRGGPEAYTVKFDKFRAAVPNPVQSKEYRDLMREQKRKGLPEDAHPLEGETIRYDATGTKPKISRIADSGEDFDVTRRYPEVVPVLQDLVDPDWTPVDAVTLGGEWEMNADHLFRLTRVVARAPIKGTIHCKLTSVIDGVATLAVQTRLRESYAQVELRIVANGTISFDVVKRRQIGSTLAGEITIGGERTGLRGSGTITASKTIVDVVDPLIPSVTGK